MCVCVLEVGGWWIGMFYYVDGITLALDNHLVHIPAGEPTAAVR